MLLMIAVAYNNNNHAPIVEELVRAGADVHAQARARARLLQGAGRLTCRT